MSKSSNAFSVILFLVFAAVTTFAVAEEPLVHGTWTKKTSSIRGSWSIVEENGTRFLILSDDFKTKKAPDLKLFLSPRALSAIDGRNASSDAALIANLKSVAGGQRYAVPDNIDLTKYSTLLLHCEKYLKVWGGAALR